MRNALLLSLLSHFLFLMILSLQLNWAPSVKLPQKPIPIKLQFNFPISSVADNKEVNKDLNKIVQQAQHQDKNIEKVKKQAKAPSKVSHKELAKSRMQAKARNITKIKKIVKLSKDPKKTTKALKSKVEKKVKTQWHIAKKTKAATKKIIANKKDAENISKSKAILQDQSSALIADCIKDRLNLISLGLLPDNFNIIAHFFLNKAGNLQKDPEIKVLGYDAMQAKIAKAQFLQAIRSCAPFKLAAKNYSIWREVQITLYPYN